MWYINSQKKDKGKDDEIGLEEKILKGISEREIRRHLFMTGDYNPENERIERIVKRVMKKVLDKYENYNVVRLHMENESLTPAIKDILNNFKINNLR